jgi:uncharacterized membrane protein
MPNNSLDRRMENSMGLLLRSGVLASCAVMAFGAVLYLQERSGEHESYSVFHGEPASLETISGVIKEASSGTARGIIQLGVLILIATPVMRVTFAVFGFAWERDYKFVAISLAVLALLAFGLFGQH